MRQNCRQVLTADTCLEQVNYFNRILRFFERLITPILLFGTGRLSCLSGPMGSGFSHMKSQNRGVGAILSHVGQSGPKSDLCIVYVYCLFFLFE